MAHDFRCREAGAISCGEHIKAEDEDEFKTKLAEHLRKKHGVNEPNDTIVDYLISLSTKGRQDDRSAGA